MPELNLNDVRTFATTVQAGSMSAAAKTLALPTSTISRSLSRLEKSLNLRLLERNATGVTLTDAGREYLPSCLEALRLLEGGEQALARQQDTPTGLLRVCCPVLMAHEIFVPLLPAFRAAYPKLQVELLPYSSGAQPTGREEADIIFQTGPHLRDSSRMRSFPAVRRGIYAARHYAERRGLPEQPEDLNGYECLGSRGTPYTTWRLTGPEGECAVTPRLVQTAADPVILREMLLQGLGITILPVWMASQPALADRIVRVLPGWEPHPVRHQAFAPGVTTFDARARHMLDFLSDRLGTDQDPRLKGVKPELCFVDELSGVACPANYKKSLTRKSGLRG